MCSFASLLELASATCCTMSDYYGNRRRTRVYLRKKGIEFLPPRVYLNINVSITYSKGKTSKRHRQIDQ